MPTILQSVAMTTYGSGTTATRTFASACTPGSRIVAIATQENQAGTFTISDPTNGTYADDSTGAGGTGVSGSGAATIRSVANTASTALTVTLTLGTATYGTFTVYELSDAVFDAGTTGLGGVATAFTGSLTAVASAFGFAIGTLYPAGASVDTSYTAAFAETGIANAYHFGEYNSNLGSAGTKTVTFNLGSPDSWSLAFATYKSAGGGGDTLWAQACL